jgi:uncharacterized protein
VHAPHAPSRDTARATLDHRSRKDEFLRDSPHSPIPPAERDAFVGLFYYPIAPSLRFEGLRLAPYTGDGPTDLSIPTSDGDARQARRAGEFRFRIGGAGLRLTAYDLGGHSLFVPFQDATSGAETYGAGRYLDLEPEADGTYTLDFNLAYFPFCAYSPRYSCPLTPSENRLPVRIAAGERLAAAGAAS